MKTTDDELKKLSEKLESYYLNLNNNMKKVIGLMHSKEMRQLFDSYLDDAETPNEINDISVSYTRLLRIILKLCNSIYNYTGEDTGISDSEYDILISLYSSITKDKDLIITENVVSENGELSHHKFTSLRGTLDKIYKITDEDVLKNKSQKTLDDWVKQTEARYYSLTGMNVNLMESDVIVMPKFDGVSVVFECDKEGNVLKALTRGDTSRNEAQDVSHIFKGIFKGSLDNQMSSYGVKTEVMMLDDKLTEYNEKYNKDYKNTRSIVSSIINSKEKDERAGYLHVVPLRISYMKNGEETNQSLAPEVYSYPYLKCKLKEVEKIHQFAFSHKTVYPGLRCDGAVIQILDEKIQNVLGRKDEKQKYEVAFKFTEETSYSEVVDVEFTAGLFGRMNPVVVFKPVKMKGNTIERASLGSFSRFNDLELCKGDKIKVLYDIIPYATFDPNDFKCERSGKKVIKPPTRCPECGDLLVTSETGDILRCENKNCPCRERGKILNFCKKMNINNISYATIEDFYREGILRSIKDLYFLKSHINKILQMDGYGINKVNLIIDEINSHKDVTASVLLGSLGIEGLSIKKFKEVMLYLSLDEIIDFSKEKNYDVFTVIPGIKEKTSKKLVNGILDNIELIKFFENELNIIKENTVESDFSVVFTKVRDDDLEQFIKENGGSVDDNVTKNTSMIIVPVSGTESSKVKKAEKYGIPIIPFGDAKEYIREKYL